MSDRAKRCHDRARAHFNYAREMARMAATAKGLPAAARRRAALLRCAATGLGHALHFLNLAKFYTDPTTENPDA